MLSSPAGLLGACRAVLAQGLVCALYEWLRSTGQLWARDQRLLCRLLLPARQVRCHRLLLKRREALPQARLGGEVLAA